MAPIVVLADDRGELVPRLASASGARRSAACRSTSSTAARRGEPRLGRNRHSSTAATGANRLRQGSCCSAVRPARSCCAELGLERDLSSTSTRSTRPLSSSSAGGSSPRRPAWRREEALQRLRSTTPPGRMLGCRRATRRSIRSHNPRGDSSRAAGSAERDELVPLSRAQSSRRVPARYGCRSSGSNASMPAGTGVCVVNTLPAAARSRASRRDPAVEDELTDLLEPRTRRAPR